MPESLIPIQGRILWRTSSHYPRRVKKGCARHTPKWRPRFVRNQCPRSVLRRTTRRVRKRCSRHNLHRCLKRPISHHMSMTLNLNEWKSLRDARKNVPSRNHLGMGKAAAFPLAWTASSLPGTAWKFQVGTDQLGMPPSSLVPQAFKREIERFGICHNWGVVALLLKANGHRQFSVRDVEMLSRCR